MAKQMKKMYCDKCDFYTDILDEYRTHILSEEHKSKALGKPVNTKEIQQTNANVNEEFSKLITKYDTIFKDFLSETKKIIQDNNQEMLQEQNKMLQEQNKMIQELNKMILELQRKK